MTGPLVALPLYIVIAVISTTSASIPPSQIRSLIRLPKILEYPAATAPLQWSSNNSVINFCGLPPKADLNLTCDPSGSTVVGLQIAGTRNSSEKLSASFSSESLGNLLSSLPDLQTLALVHLGLWGNISGKLDHLQQLKFVNFSSNSIAGSLPQRLSTLSQLQVLDLSRNEIDGNFPSWLGDLRNLTSMDVSNNQMSGSIASDLSLPSSLRFMDVSSNLLTGQPPKVFLANSTLQVRFENNCMATTSQVQLSEDHCVHAGAKSSSSTGTGGTPTNADLSHVGVPLITCTLIAGASLFMF